MPRFLPFVALLALALAAPASAADPTPREKGDLAIRARFVLKTYCHDCHGGAQSRGRFVALNYLNLVATGSHPVPFVAPGKPDESQVVQFVEDGSMPPGTRKRPTADERKVLKDWIAAGAPSFPAEFDDGFTVQSMLDDLRRQKDGDAQHLRYFTLAHLVRDADPFKLNLQRVEDELSAALCALDATSPKDRRVIAPVGDTATLYRFDVRALDWDNRELFFRPVSKGTSPSVYDLTAYDLLLFEYPHASAPDPQLRDYLTQAKLARPVPFLRADWVSRALAKDSPLAEDLRSLTELSKALRAQRDPELGKESGMPCGTRSRTLGGPEPGASVGAWYSGDVTPSRLPFALSAGIVDLEGKPLESVAAGQPFRIAVSGKKNARFVLLMRHADGELRVQPTNMKGMLDADEVELTPETTNAFKISDLPAGEEKATEYFVLLAAELNGEFPAPVVVQSRHKTLDCDAEKRLPVYRFVFDDRKVPGGFDPARVVRRVIPVPVTVK